VKRKQRGITIFEILVVILLSISTLFLVVDGITSINMSSAKQVEYLNCLSIAKTYLDLYSYKPSVPLTNQPVRWNHNIGSLAYEVSVYVQDFRAANVDPNLGLRRVTITVSSNRIRTGNRNLSVSLITVI
jgi:type II secretory pathway pseudopilin PulG